MMIKKILVPVDFSSLSRKALVTAGSVARLFKAKVTPLHVFMPVTEMDEPYSFGLTGSTWQDLEKVEEDLVVRLRELSTDLVPAEFLLDPVVEMGQPSRSIVDLSSSYDMIVMSTHGRTGFSRMILGSVAEKVLRMSPVPVMVVEGSSEPGNFEKILVTTDFSDNASAAYPWARTFCEQSGGSVHLLHILSYSQIGMDESDSRLLDLRKERLKLSAKSAFSDLGNRATYEVAETADSPHEAIYRHTDENQYDLVIMATVGRTGLQYLMMGSTTANVVRHVESPVLSIPPIKEQE
ncbi:MAG: universal stress protein [Balneolaceae bacterium]